MWLSTSEQTSASSLPFMARLVGATGRVQAFEPNPIAADLLLASLERNAIKNVDVHRFALGASQGTLPLVIPRENIGSASLLHRADRGDSVEVPVRSLSKALEGHEPRSIRLVKIDVEGYERDVLTGAQSLFERVPPDAIISECWNESDAARALVMDLRGFGYDVFVIARTSFGSDSCRSDTWPRGSHCHMTFSRFVRKQSHRR